MAQTQHYPVLVFQLLQLVGVVAITWALIPLAAGQEVAVDMVHLQLAEQPLLAKETTVVEAAILPILLARCILVGVAVAPVL